jgi:predicted dehydrogenase
VKNSLQLKAKSLKQYEMKKLKGVCIGAGYFSHFQYEAWNRMPEVEITAMCNSNPERAQYVMKTYGVKSHYTNYLEMLDKEKPDFVDIITPPGTHVAMTKESLERGIHVICQKPLAPTIQESLEIKNLAESHKPRFMVHENWRFQPWYREIKKLLAKNVIGAQIFNISFRMRMGDGWGERAYLDRQPYFRDYPKLLIYETGVHFIDTYRYLLGDIKSVYASLRKLNPVIAGEDAGFVHFNFASGAQGIYDANRYNETNFKVPRYTFGELLLEGEGGSLRLYADGKMTMQQLGKGEQEHAYAHENKNFAGDCVYACQRHFMDHLIDGKPFETSAGDYLKTLSVQEAVYASNDRKAPVDVQYV